MDINIELKPKIRRGKKRKFIVEENVVALQWPQECAVCSKPVEVYDDNEDKSASFMNCYKVSPPKVPYCQTCYTKVKATKRLDTAVMFLGVIFGLPLGIFLAYLLYKTYEKITKELIFCMGSVAVLGFFVCVKLIKFIIRGPIKSIFKNRYTGYVEFDDQNKKLPDNNSAWFLEIFIPNKRYSDKFAILNSVDDSEALKGKSSQSSKNQ